jgi:ankyrin repeat protein
VRLLLERGADPTTASNTGYTPLVAAPTGGCLEVVRLLLGDPTAKTTLNHRSGKGETALWWACLKTAVVGW